MPDPTAPGWRAEYTGTDPGNVGSGNGSAPICTTWTGPAGTSCPESPRSTVSSPGTCTTSLRACGRSSTFRAGGWETSHQRLLELRDEVHDVLRQTCLRMREAGAALVATADDYASSDEAAAAAFNRLLDEYADDYAGPPPHVPDPPAVHDPPAPPPQTERGFSCSPAPSGPVTATTAPDA